MAQKKLTEALRKSIVASAQATRDFDTVTKATGASQKLLDSWIQRGAKEKAGIYRELLDELKPFLREMYRRQIWSIQTRFFAQLGAMSERDKKFERILTVWFNTVWLNDNRVSEATRFELANQLIKILGRRPIHASRWRSMKQSLTGLSDSQITELTLSAVFVAAGILKTEQPENPPPALEQISDNYRALRRLIGNLLSEDLAGPGWRKKRVEMEYKDEGSDPGVDEEHARQARLRQREELRKLVLQRLALLTRKTSDEIEDLIERHQPKNIGELAEKLGITRLALYRKVINPTRKE